MSGGENFRDLHKCLQMYQIYGNESMAMVNPNNRPKIIQVQDAKNIKNAKVIGLTEILGSKKQYQMLKS